MNTTLIKWVATSAIAAVLTKAAQPAIKKAVGLDPNKTVKSTLMDELFNNNDYLFDTDSFLEEEE